MPQHLGEGLEEQETHQLKVSASRSRAGFQGKKVPDRGQNWGSCFSPVLRLSIGDHPTLHPLSDGDAPRTFVVFSRKNRGLKNQTKQDGGPSTVEITWSA